MYKLILKTSGTASGKQRFGQGDTRRKGKGAPGTVSCQGPLEIPTC